MIDYAAISTHRVACIRSMLVAAALFLAQPGFSAISAGSSSPVSSQSIFGTAAIGPIDAIATGNSGTEITVLGQKFLSGSIDVSGYKVGQYVLAAADQNGKLSVLLSLDDSYVPGSSTVWLKGAVTSVSSATAKFSIGGVSLDYSAHLSSDPTFSVQTGDVIEAYGIQPVPGGSVLLGIHGGGSNTQGIHGGGAMLQGIHGGGGTLLGIHGGGGTLLGIHGGGGTLLGIHGGGGTLLGIHGGGGTLLGIHGGGGTLLGIHGGGGRVQGIHGGGGKVQGIHGGGSSVQGIHGGGSSVQGIHGGGGAAF